MSIHYRPLTETDLYATFQIFQASVMDLGQRMGVMAITGGDDPEVIAGLFEKRRPLLEHLTRTAEHQWLAENDGQPVGYARSVFRDGTRQLTEFFTIPGQQSAGVGKELLRRAFPTNDGARLIIIATQDVRAFARYLKAGVYPRSLVIYWSRMAEPVTYYTDLDIQAMTPDDFPLVAEIDKVVVGYRRDADHDWLLTERQGFLYQRQGQMVGYGYIGYRSGPFALLQAGDFPAVLAHAESTYAGQGEFGIEVSMSNTTVIQYLLARRFQMSSFFAHFMTDVPFGKYTNYVFTSPPFFS